MSALPDEQPAAATPPQCRPALAERVVRLMPELKADLLRLARIR